MTDELEHATCLEGCHYDETEPLYPDGPRRTPKPIHAEGCPHSESPYVEHAPAPIGWQNPA